MLVIVMHNNSDYLTALVQLAKKDGIAEAIVVEEKGLGVRMVGGEGDVILSKGQNIAAYDKAFVAVIKSDIRRQYFLGQVETNEELQRLNVESKGFICTIPFHYIKHLEM